MQKFRYLFRFMFALSILFVVCFITQQSTNGDTNGSLDRNIDLTAPTIKSHLIEIPQEGPLCKESKETPKVLAVITPLTKEQLKARQINPSLATVDLLGLYRCSSDDPLNPGCNFIDRWQPLVNAKAYYRDAIFSTRIFIFNPDDQERIGAIYTRPGGSTFGGGLVTYFNLLNGQNSCFQFTDGFTICDFNAVQVDFFFFSQCAEPGDWKVDLVRGFVNQQLQTFQSAPFTLVPEVGQQLPPYEQTGNDNPYDNICLDFADGLKVKPCEEGNPNLITATIANQGCTLTVLATILQYHGVDTTVSGLNNYLSAKLGYDEISNQIRLAVVQKYANEKAPGQISEILVEEGNDFISLYNNICLYGPIGVGIRRGTPEPHTLTAFGAEIIRLGGASVINSFKVQDPIFAAQRFLNDPVAYGDINNTFGEQIIIKGPQQTVNLRRLSIMFFSPVEAVITDPLGRRTGLNPQSNTKFKEIPKAYYGQYTSHGPDQRDIPKLLDIPGAMDGEYTLTVIGTGEGTYSSDMTASDLGGNISTFILKDIPTAPNMVHTYKINYSGVAGSQLQIAASFDGGGQRPRDVNKFLSYANPSESSTTLPAGTTSFPLIILYDRNVVASTFKADLNGTDITSSFNPQPGKVQVVNIPLQSGSNVLKLSIDGNLSNRTATDSDRLVFKVQ
jgi:hypothetical protein